MPNMSVFLGHILYYKCTTKVVIYKNFVRCVNVIFGFEIVRISAFSNQSQMRYGLVHFVYMIVQVLLILEDFITLIALSYIIRRCHNVRFNILTIVLYKILKILWACLAIFCLTKSINKGFMFYTKMSLYMVWSLKCKGTNRA